MCKMLSCIILFSVMQLIAARIPVCELKSTLQTAIDAGRLPKTVQDWLCLIYEDTNYAETTVKDGRYGLFQIQSPTYCTYGSKGGDCNKDCRDFTNKDISDDIACANQIYNSRGGFSYWKIWTEKCKGRDLSGYGGDCK